MTGPTSSPRYLPGETDGDIRREGKADVDAALIEAELQYIADNKGAQASHVAALLGLLRGKAKGADAPYLFGLGLSGGGIRSATFSLGVMQRLAQAFNPAAATGVMCRYTLSVGWNGMLYDCDFNQMLDLPVGPGSPRHIRDFNLSDLRQRTIVTGNHCYGCTAGAGSSCGGAVAT